MKLTNRAGLPQAFCDAVTNDSYSRGDARISVTGLLRPPRMGVLEEVHHDKLETDVSDRVWALLGQAIHKLLENANLTAVAERRLSMEIEGWLISGGMDLYEEKGILLDYKMTTKYKIKDELPQEWVEQLNCYAVLLRHHNIKVEKLQVVAMLRDWSKREAERDPLYPQAQVININIPLWEPERAFQFMRNRVILHQQARIELPECTPAERWARPDQYAVMKKGAKRAVKLYASEAEAKAHVGFDKNLSVEYRPGESVRCESYCQVKNFCSQYLAEQTRAASPTDASTCIENGVKNEE